MKYRIEEVLSTTPPPKYYPQYRSLFTWYYFEFTENGEHNIVTHRPRVYFSLSEAKKFLDGYAEQINYKNETIKHIDYIP